MDNVTTALNFTRRTSVGLSDLVYLIHGTGSDRDSLANIADILAAGPKNGLGSRLIIPEVNSGVANVVVSEDPSEMYVVLVDTSSGEVTLNLSALDNNDIAYSVVVLNKANASGAHAIHFKYHPVDGMGNGGTIDIDKNSIAWMVKRYVSQAGIVFSATLIPNSLGTQHLASLILSDSFSLTKNGKTTTIDQNGVASNAAGSFNSLNVDLSAHVGGDIDVNGTVDAGHANVHGAFHASGTALFDGVEEHNGAIANKGIVINEAAVTNRTTVNNLGPFFQYIAPILGVGLSGTAALKNAIVPLLSSCTPAFTAKAYNEIGKVRIVVNAYGSAPITVNFITYFGEKSYSIPAGSAIIAVCVELDDGNGFSKFAIIGG